MAVKPYAEDGKIKLAYATADTFLPISWTNNRIDEGVFASEIKRQGKTYTHLEWHVKENGQYIVRNELYESTSGVDLGHRVPLSTLYENLQEVATLNGVQRPIFTYFKPNLANNIDSTVRWVSRYMPMPTARLRHWICVR